MVDQQPAPVTEGGRVVSATKKERFKSGPENETWNQLKGKKVRIGVTGRSWETHTTGVLVWVDVYTIGLRRTEKQKVPTIIYKGPGLMVELAE